MMVERATCVLFDFALALCRLLSLDKCARENRKCEHSLKERAGAGKWLAGQRVGKGRTENSVDMGSCVREPEYM
jgi:hypothetical protein